MTQGERFFNQKYQAVIFDLFGTLVDIFSRLEYERVLKEIASILEAPYEQFSIVWYQTTISRGTGVFRTLEENFEYISHELKINFPKNQIKRACQVRMDFVADALKPREDALETLAQLKSLGYKTGLISNCSTEPPVLWPDTPFAPFFDVAIFSSTSGLQKPNPRIYTLTAEKLSVRPEDCLYVGDGDSDELTGALNAGMHPVLIRDPGENSHNVIRTGYQGTNWPGPVIMSLKEVLTLL